MKMIDVVFGTLVIALAITLSSCAFHVGVDWNGETAKDNRTYTAKDKK